MSTPRRSRYTAFFEGREPSVILTYSAENAREYYTKRGYTVVRITKGDHRKQAHAREREATGGFHIDRAALKEAQRILGLKLPVKVRLHGRHGQTDGNHQFKGAWHNIMLKRYLTPEEATEALWHELTHALQAERQGTKTKWTAHSSNQRRYAYRIRPIEIEARQMANRMAPNHPLCR